MPEILHFHVSTGLKNIIGRELINNKHIAIFELVKNSYDAGAHTVKISFIKEPAMHIIIQDDGDGMDKEAIINKWLFVAYSEKRNPSYRDSIKREIAGAKGVGRFSCDRLGRRVCLQSTIHGESILHEVNVCWDDFEQNDKESFSDVNVSYSSLSAPTSCKGTKIIISELREEWSRDELLQLKKALTKLVNPSATDAYDPFNIELSVPHEQAADDKQHEYRDKVNGLIENKVFDLIHNQTITIDVTISPNGDTICTSLIDRGTFLFKMEEKNEFSLENISCHLSYLNKSAKSMFTKNMGVEAINYGSVFVYKNGFRVYPYGNPGDDFFGIDQRKQQGYNRFLGTREIIGQLQINGINTGLNETSSRNNGFVDSYELNELKEFFIEYVLKPLEKYVVQIVHWAENDNLVSELSKSEDNLDIIRVIKKIKSRTNIESILSVEKNTELISLIGQYKAKATSVSDALRTILENSNSPEVEKNVKHIEQQTRTLEKMVREATETVEQSQEELDSVKEELKTTKRQVEILGARAELTAAEAIEAMHIMKSYADVVSSLTSEINEVVSDEAIDIAPIASFLSDIRLTCSKIVNAYNLVMHTQFAADTNISKGDIVDFINQYVKTLSGSVNISLIVPPNISRIVNFNPLEFSVILDNILSNSRKARAHHLSIAFEDISGGLMLTISDDGTGLKKTADPARIFEPGYTKTNGSGIGLSTIQNYITKIGGKVRYNAEYTSGFQLVLELSHEPKL